MARARRSGASKLTHFVHGPSAGGSIRQLLRTLERDELVVCLDDNLALGPINPVAPSARRRWMLENLGHCYWSARGANRFWDASVSSSLTPVVWLSRRDAQQYTCLLELVWRRREAPLVIDIADMDLSGNDTSRSINIVRHEVMVEQGFIEQARRLGSDEVDRLRTEWHWARAANEAVRIQTTTGLASVWITHFDDTLISSVPVEWTSCAQVIAHALWGQSKDQLAQLDDLFLFGRLSTLVEAGLLEGRGDFGWFQTCEVRQPVRRRRPRR